MYSEEDDSSFNLLSVTTFSPFFSTKIKNGNKAQVAKKEPIGILQ